MPVEPNKAFPSSNTRDQQIEKEIISISSANWYKKLKLLGLYKQIILPSAYYTITNSLMEVFKLYTDSKVQKYFYS